MPSVTHGSFSDVLIVREEITYGMSNCDWSDIWCYPPKRFFSPRTGNLQLRTSFAVFRRLKRLYSESLSNSFELNVVLSVRFKGQHNKYIVGQSH